MNALGSTVRFLIAAALVGTTLGTTLGGADGPTTANQGPKTPAEIASAIANTIRATTPTTPGAPITFASATSHDNVVEIRYVVTDAGAFARFKGNAESSRVSLASFFCNESHRGALIQGVVIHELFALSAGNDQVDFTIDKSSCDGLPRVALADARTLAELAVVAAKAENESAARPSKSPFHLAEAAAHEGVVDLRFIITDASAAAQVDRRRLAAVLRGYMCTKYRDSILRGLVLHPVFGLANGPPTVEFTIDRSTC